MTDLFTNLFNSSNQIGFSYDTFQIVFKTRCQNLNETCQRNQSTIVAIIYIKNTEVTTLDSVNQFYKRLDLSITLEFSYWLFKT
jgi:hypothetical protein